MGSSRIMNRFVPFNDITDTSINLPRGKLRELFILPEYLPNLIADSMSIYGMRIQQSLLSIILGNPSLSQKAG